MSLPNSCFKWWQLCKSYNVSPFAKKGNYFPKCISCFRLCVVFHLFPGQIRTRQRKVKLDQVALELRIGGHKAEVSVSAVPMFVSSRTPWPGSTTYQTPRGELARWARESAMEQAGLRLKSILIRQPTHPSGEGTLLQMIWFHFNIIIGSKYRTCKNVILQKQMVKWKYFILILSKTLYALIFSAAGENYAFQTYIFLFYYLVLHPSAVLPQVSAALHPWTSVQNKSTPPMAQQKMKSSPSQSALSTLQLPPIAPFTHLQETRVLSIVPFTKLGQMPQQIAPSTMQGPTTIQTVQSTPQVIPLTARCIRQVVRMTLAIVTAQCTGRKHRKNPPQSVHFTPQQFRSASVPQNQTPRRRRLRLEIIEICQEETQGASLPLGSLSLVTIVATMQ